MLMTAYDVIIVGAGAAGLMCAAQAGRRGRKVLVLEKANKVGKKILMSGGGKCNFTNMYVEPENFICHNPHFVISALTRYSQWDFLGLVTEHGIAYEERKHGQLFTVDGAKHILQLLLQECAQSQNVTIVCQAELLKVEKQQHFVVHSSIGLHRAEALVIASGGLSIPSLGGSAVGYHIATQFGHHLYPTRAGLVPFTFSDDWKAHCAHLSGNSLPATLSNTQASFKEALLFTHRGLSGPSALQLSNYWQLGESFNIDFFPELALSDYLLTQKTQQPKVLLRTVLAELMPKNLVLVLQQVLWPTYSDSALAQIPPATLQAIATQLQAYSVKPSGTEGYRTAEVTLGGVDCDQVSSKTMQSRLQPGLYFVGEVLDVTGHLGGFNFQWAWSSGHAAGTAV
jgi:predicted Rossmann fold flavoprotein